MTAMPAVARMTAEEYLARPEDPAERGRELIDGVIVDMHDPRLPHELACRELHHALETWTRARPGRGLPIRSIDVALELTRDDEPTSPLLPGFALTLDAVFGE